MIPEPVLGIDLGSSRVRIAEVAYHGNGRVLSRVSIIDLTEREQVDDCSIAAAIATALREAGIKQRRCVASIGEPEAMIRWVNFPPMSAGERDRAARFEAVRHIDYPLDEAHVRTQPIDPKSGAYAVGIARRQAFARRRRILSAAGLRPSTIDYDAFALHRVFPFADAVLDIGLRTSRLYAFGSRTPIGLVLGGGGRAFTDAIAQSLLIDTQGAERRKRSLGCAGSGEAEFSAFRHSVAGALLSARSLGAREIQRLVLCGNGARLASLPQSLERDTGCTVDLAAHLDIDRSEYPDDVTSAGAPDWALCVGLALWMTTRARAA